MTTTVTFPVNRGGDGLTYSDDADPITGLDNYGYVTRFMMVASNVLGVGNFAVTQADAATAAAAAAAASAASALNAPGTNATSTSSVTIGAGTRSLTIQSGKAYVVGQTLTIASTASPANQMTGIVTSYNSGTGFLVVSVPAGGTAGSGTFASWTVSMGVIVNSTLPTLVSDRFLFNTAGAVSWEQALTPAGNLSGLANYTTARANLGLAIGTNVQAFNANLTAMSGLSLVADRLIYASGTGALSLTTFSAFARTLVDDADAAAARITLGAQASHASLTAFVGLTGAANKLPYFTGASTMGVADLSSFARTLIDDVDADAARATLDAAKRGANADITSLTGLTTPLSIAQGGTGAATAAAALAALIPVTTVAGGLIGEFSLGGVKVKWGQISLTGKSSGNSGEATVIFTANSLTAFPSLCAGVWVIPDQPAGAVGGTTYAPYVRSLSATGFTAGLDSTGTPDNAYTCYWLAIGV